MYIYIERERERERQAVVPISKEAYVYREGNFSAGQVRKKRSNLWNTNFSKRSKVGHKYVRWLKHRIHTVRQEMIDIKVPRKI